MKLSPPLKLPLGQNSRFREASVPQIIPADNESKNLFCAVGHFESLKYILGCAVNKDSLNATPCTLAACHLSVSGFKISEAWLDPTSYSSCCWCQIN